MQSAASVSPRCELQQLGVHTQRVCFAPRLSLRQRAQQLRSLACFAHPHNNSAFAAALAALAPPHEVKLARRVAVPQQSSEEGSHLYDVLGLGQAMVDYSASVDDEVLSQCNVPKGARRQELALHTQEISFGAYCINSLILYTNHSISGTLYDFSFFLRLLVCG